MAKLISGLTEFDRRIPGSSLDPKRPVNKIAGMDHCAGGHDGSNEDYLNDLDADVTIENSPGGPYGRGQ